MHAGDGRGVGHMREAAPQGFDAGCDQQARKLL